MERLPAAASLDKFSYRVNATIFPLWTFTIIAGAIWAGEAWGRYWGWDSKEIWSFVTWVAYAAYLHARATAGWKGRKAPTWACSLPDVHLQLLRRELLLLGSALLLGGLTRSEQYPGETRAVRDGGLMDRLESPVPYGTAVSATTPTPSGTS